MKLLEAVDVLEREAQMMSLMEEIMEKVEELQAMIEAAGETIVEPEEAPEITRG